MASGVLLYSCKKNDSVDEVVNKSLSELSAPASFKWSGSRDVTLSIGISDASFQNAIHVVKIYNAEPAKGGELISSGSATLIKPFNTKITLSSLINQVYIEKVAPNGAVVGQLLTLTSDSMSAALSATGLTEAKPSFGLTKGISALRPNITVPTEVSPTCDAPYDVEITSAIASSNDYLLLTGKVYVIKQSNVSITFNQAPQPGTTLRICGSNVTVNSFKIQNGSSIIVSSGATNVNLGNFQWAETGTFKNFGETTVGNLDVKGTFVNQGTLKMGSSTFTLNSSSTAVNTGTFTSGNFIANAPYSNSGSMSVDGFTANANATGKNTGTIVVNSNIQLSAEFSTTGTLTLKSGMQLKSGSDFSNTNIVTVAGNAEIEGEFATSGNMTFNGGQVVFKGSNLPLTNTGLVTANTKMTLEGRTFTNGGTVRVNELTLNSASKIINNCKWYVVNNVKNEINGPIENNSYFFVAGGMNINSNGKITLAGGALLSTNSIYDSFSEKIVGTGATKAVLKITGTIPNLQNHSNSAKFSGNLDVVYTASTLPTTMFEGNATQKASAATVYIPTGDCMEVGSGTAPSTPTTPPDADGDGVSDSEDKFKNDATRAYIIESENYANGGSTVAFEDSWPLKGDYDLNDVVINYKYQVITNAQNKVVGVRANYRLLATGGEFQNGAGIEFPIPAASVKNLVGPTGVSFESGQAKAVLILFTNSRAEQATWNTETGKAVSPVKEFAITFDVENGPDQAAFGVSNFNPFIWNNSPGFATRKFETHLFGKTPTTLAANSGLFGTGDDRTDGTRYYGTGNNLPWAITLPTATFKYPLERVPIDQGYKMFKTWAESGGTSTLDWYINTSSSYRDGTKLFGN